MNYSALIFFFQGHPGLRATKSALPYSGEGEVNPLFRVAIHMPAETLEI